MAQGIFGDREYDSLQRELEMKMRDLKDDRVRIEAYREDLERTTEKINREIKRYETSATSIEREIERLHEKMRRRREDIIREQERKVASDTGTQSRKSSGSFW